MLEGFLRGLVGLLEGLSLPLDALTDPALFGLAPGLGLFGLAPGLGLFDTAPGLGLLDLGEGDPLGFSRGVLAAPRAFSSLPAKT